MATVKKIEGKTLYKLTMGPKEASVVMAWAAHTAGNKHCYHLYYALAKAGVEYSQWNVTSADGTINVEPEGASL